jgi:lambda repressor-like predicted transcriptional regulator
MHPEQIKAAIRMKGTTPSAIADAMGLSRTAVTHVIRGVGVSLPVAQRISEVTGVPIALLWPGKYLPKKKAEASEASERREKARRERERREQERRDGERRAGAAA